MDEINIELILPTQLGAFILSREHVHSAISDNRTMKVRSISRVEASELAHRDFGATAVTLLGTAAVAAAVTGIFDIIKSVVHEIFETRRQRNAQAHERLMLALKIGVEEYDIILDHENNVTDQLNKLQDKAISRLTK